MLINVSYTETLYLVKVLGGLYMNTQNLEESLGLMAPQISFIVPAAPSEYLSLG